MTLALVKRVWLGLLLFAAVGAPLAARADTVASLLGNFTINQYCGLEVERTEIKVHYVVVFGQLPALRELHFADADGDGVTSQSERDAYVGRLASGFAKDLALRVDGRNIPLRAVRWTSSLPTEQGGFSLRIDVDFAAPLPASLSDASRKLEFDNRNYAGRMGWHEIVVTAAPHVAVFDSNAYGSSLTGALTEALKSLPAAGPLDERSIHLSFGAVVPAGAKLLTDRAGRAAPLDSSRTQAPGGSWDSEWIVRHTRRLVDSIASPHVQPSVAFLALLGALLLGAVHALSPGHGKTIVGAYLIGSRGTPRHALFLGLTVTVTHTIGVFLLGFATLYASRYIVPERIFPVLSLISAALVFGMGAWLLVQRGRAARCRPMAAAEPQRFRLVKSERPPAARPHRLILAPAMQLGDGTLHSHGGGPMHSHLPPGAAGERITWRSLLTLGISGGLVPCPSAMVLLLAAVALNKTAYGMLLVGAFSVGLAATLTVVGIAFLYARNRFGSAHRAHRWTRLLPVLSAGFIALMGVVLCIGAIRSFGS
jgi:nickel/cobalt exporter